MENKELVNALMRDSTRRLSPTERHKCISYVAKLETQLATHKWVNVDDRLPNKKDGFVSDYSNNLGESYKRIEVLILIRNGYGKFRKIAYFNLDDMLFMYPLNESDGDEITHFQPFSDFPRPKEAMT